MRARLILLCVATSLTLCLGACGTMQQTVDDVKVDSDPNSPVRKDAETAGARVGGAVAAPLHDVNIIRTKIPPVLLDAADAPYERPRPLSCATIRTAMEPLDAALGPDIDKPKAPKPTGAKKDEALAGDATIDTIKGAAEGVIPFRGLVRLVSGAEREDKQVNAAILAGQVRRSFLKGLGLNLHCEPPAAPLRAALEAMPSPRPVKDASAAAKP